MNISSVIMVSYCGSSIFNFLSFFILNINPSILCSSQFINNFSKFIFNFLFFTPEISLKYSLIFFDILISLSFKSILKLIMCFSNLFKKGGSNFNSSIFSLLTIIITLKSLLISEDIFAYSKAILANFLSPILVKF